MSADAQFRAFIDRILRCREAEDAAKEDTKAVYAELAGEGYEKAVAGQVVNFLRKREKNGDKLAEQSALFDLYLDAYERASHTHTRARGFVATLTDEQKAAALAYRGDDTHGGEITDTQEQPETASQSHPEKSVTSNLVAAHEGDESAALNSPETANEILGGVAGACSGIKCGENRTGTESETSGDSAERHADDGRDVEASGGAASVITIPPSAVTPPAADKTGAAPLPSSAAPVELTDDDVPDFIKRTHKPLRPHCLNPDLCAGSGTKHCYSCLKARDDATVAA